MGLFDKLKNLISKKEKIKEEVKKEYNVEEVSEISKNMIEEIEEFDDIEEELEEEDIDVIDDEEHHCCGHCEDDEECSCDNCHCHDEDAEEFEEDEESDEDEDDDWAEFVKSHQKVQEAQDIETYDKGLEKTRKEFVSKLSMLGVKYTKIDEDYFEELEEILINADVGVNTVMNFIDQLRDRVKKEKITDTEYLNEVIVDELFIIYELT